MLQHCAQKIAKRESDRLTINAAPGGAAQLEIYKRVALPKAKDERSRKVIMTGRLVMRPLPCSPPHQFVRRGSVQVRGVRPQTRTFCQGVELGQTGIAGIAVTV